MNEHLLRAVLSLMLFLSLPSAYGQVDSILPEPDQRTYTEIMDNKMQNLNFSNVPYGILYDRVYPFAMLTDSLYYDTVDVDYFVQACSELQRADTVYVPHDSVYSYKVVRPWLWGENQADRIPVLAFNAQFSSIDPAALEDGRIDTFQGVWQHGSNAATPFLTHEAMFAVVGIDRELEVDKNYTL